MARIQIGGDGGAPSNNFIRSLRDSARNDYLIGTSCVPADLLLADTDEAEMASMELPQVSIIIASFNHGPFVDESIRSVLRQTYNNIQLIVIDDDSPDDSVARIKRLQDESNGFLFLRNPDNIGLQRSLERAMNEVSGEYVGLLASDDFILEDKIEQQVAFLKQNDMDGVYSSGYVLKEDGRKTPMDMSRVEEMFKAGTYLNHIYVCDTYGAMFQSGLFRTKVLRSLAYIRQQFWSDDWAISIKLLENYRIGFLNVPTFCYRLHDSNTHKDIWKTFPGRIQVVSQITPSEFRFVGLSNVIGSHGSALIAKNDDKLGSRLMLASIVIDFSYAKLINYLTIINFPFIRLFYRVKGFIGAISNKIFSVVK